VPAWLLAKFARGRLVPVLRGLRQPPSDGSQRRACSMMSINLNKI
jgi:hypothetical protein